jgi:dihydroorotate dehydrogenase electron transfer subunit
MQPHDCSTHANNLWHGTVSVVENVALARDTYRIRLDCPEIAGRIVPGQFVMLRMESGNDPLLGRPLALYDAIRDAEGAPRWLDIVYLTIGKMTKRLAEFIPGELLHVWGPLGNGFPPLPADHLVMVAGGIGQTPFVALAKEYLGRERYGESAEGINPPARSNSRESARAKKVTLCYGAKTAAFLAGMDDFRKCGVHVRLSTDDGTAGHRGLVTELIEPAVLAEKGACRIVCCGPEPMLDAVAKIAAKLNVPCQVSLETPMACGIGICFSCVAKIRDAAGNWDYRRTCVEGPVFDAADVDFG